MLYCVSQVAHPRSRRVHGQPECLECLDRLRAVSLGRGSFKQPRAHRFVVFRRLLQTPARLQPAHHRECKNLASRIGRRARRIGKIKSVTHHQPEERRRCYAKHLHRLSVDHQRGVGRDRRSAHLRFPEGVARHHLRHAASSLILRLDQPSLPWRNAEYVKEISANLESIRTMRIARLSQQHSVRAPRKHTREWIVMILHFLPHGNGEVPGDAVVDPESSSASGDANLSQFARLHHRQAAQPHRIQKFEDRRIRTNAQCQRGDNNKREAGTLHKSAQRRSQHREPSSRGPAPHPRPTPVRAWQQDCRNARAHRALPRSRLIPSAMLSSMHICMCSCSSAWISRSMRERLPSVTIRRRRAIPHLMQNAELRRHL